jgi:hypothetical protein
LNVSIDLNGMTFFVSVTADGGVVNSATRLHFRQMGTRVIARYAGGDVTRGCLVGCWHGERVVFRYAQRERDSSIHGGRSDCEVQRLEHGRVRIVEHFTWSTRVGCGVNVFDEVEGA